MQHSIKHLLCHINIDWSIDVYHISVKIESEILKNPLDNVLLVCHMR